MTAQWPDARSDEAIQLLAEMPACKGGYLFSSPDDPRQKEILAYRERVAKLLHQAVVRLSDQGNDDAIDCVKSVISTIKTFMLDVPQDRSIYQGSKKTCVVASDLAETSAGTTSCERSLASSRIRSCSRGAFEA